MNLDNGINKMNDLILSFICLQMLVLDGGRAPVMKNSAQVKYCLIHAKILSINYSRYDNL